MKRKPKPHRTGILPFKGIWLGLAILVGLLFFVESTHTRDVPPADPKKEPPADKTEVPPGKTRRVSPSKTHATPTSATDSRRNARFEKFTAQFGDNWRVKWNDKTDTPHSLSGGNIQLDRRLTEETVEEITRQFLSDNAYLLGAESSALTLTKADYDKPLRPEHKQGTWYVFYRQDYRGIPVHGSSVKLIIKNQRIVSVGSDFYPDIRIHSAPEITQQQALEIVNGHLGRSLEARETTLIVYPNERPKGLEHHLAWKLEMPTIDDPTVETKIVQGRQIRIEKPMKAWVYFIDAHTGEILFRYDTITYGSVQGTVTGMVYDTTPDQPQVQVPIAHQYVDVLQGGIVVETDTTDASGTYSSADTYVGQVEIMARLKGPHVEVHNNETPDPDATHNSGPLTLDTTHDWNWSVDDPSPQDVETNVFYHVNFIHDWFLQGDPFDVSPWPYPMQVHVRIGEGCNAWAANDGLTFYSGSPGGCLDYALGADIIYHEYVHRVFDKLYVIANVSYGSGFTGAMNEGLADYFACSITNDSWNGEVIYEGRDIETGEIWNQLPEGNNRRYPRDWIDEVHADGLIFNGAIWDARKVLGADYTDDLAMRALKQTPETFSEYLGAMLIADDDDADLANGTPNITTLCQAFYDNHGIFHAACTGYTANLVAEITSPSLSEFYLIDGTVDAILVLGSAYGSNTSSLANFKVDYASETDPDNWSDVGMALTGGGSVEVVDDLLANWNLTSVVDGKYTIRLTVKDGSGAESISTTSVVIQRSLHAGWPQPTTYWVLGSPALGDLDLEYPGLEIVVGAGGLVWAFHHDGTPQGGIWSYDTKQNVSASPAIGDVDGDGSLEVVISAFKVDQATDLYILNSDGALYSPAWPLSIAAMTPQFTARPSSPALGDIDEDGDLEIVIGSANDSVYVFHHDGSPLQNWPQPTSGGIESTPAIGDIDPDYPGLEIVVGSKDSSVYAWHADGTKLSEAWPISTGGEVLSSPALGNLDDDAYLEIVVGSNDSTVYAWNHDGSELFKKMVTIAILSSSPALGDIDSDGNLEILAMSSDNNLYIWQGDGTPYEPWTPLSDIKWAGFEFNPSSPAMGDIDGDGDIEIVVESIWGKIHAFHHDGTPVGNGWPKYIFPWANGSSPTICDIDEDGKVEIMVGSPQEGLFVWDLEGVYNPDKMDWPMFHHDVRRSGLYVSPPVFIYVNALTGDDWNDGSSPTFESGNVGPKKTIQAGIDAIPSDGTCVVAAGKYAETIIMKDGVTLSGAGPDVTLLHGNGTGNVITIGSVYVPSTNATIKGFKITGGGSYGDNAGIRIQNSTNSVISNNVMTKNGADAIRVYSGSPTIINNTIVTNRRNGVMVHYGATPVIKNNIIVSNTASWPNKKYGWGVFASDNAIITSSFNDVWRNNNDYGSMTGGVSQPGDGDISQNPLFIDLPQGKFHLKPQSPCVDAGVDVGLPFFGSAPDMGAFELEQ